MAIGDVTQNNADLNVPLSSSQLTVRELLAFLIDPRASDASRTSGALDYLRAISLNSVFAGQIPSLASVANATILPQPLIPCPADKAIHLLFLFISVNALTTISFVNAAAVNLFGPFYTAGQGAGLAFEPRNGIILPKGNSLFVQSSVATNWSATATFGLLDC